MGKSVPTRERSKPLRVDRGQNADCMCVSVALLLALVMTAMSQCVQWIKKITVVWLRPIHDFTTVGITYLRKKKKRLLYRDVPLENNEIVNHAHISVDQTYITVICLPLGNKRNTTSHLPVSEIEIYIYIYPVSNEKNLS